MVAHAAVPLKEEVLERDALDAAMVELASLFAAPDNARSALFVASTDAGSRTALRFWADAQRTGVALANPELFPWCLANATCGAIARRFGITGPNATWLGDYALAAAWAAAGAHLAKRPMDRVFVVAVDFGHADTTPKLDAWRLESSHNELPPPGGP